MSSEAERFLRVVGRRRTPEAGAPPSHAAREAMSRMASYRTRAPKGVFVYGSHAQANEERERWLLDAMVERKQDRQRDAR